MTFDYHVLVRYYPLLLQGLGWTVLITIIALAGGAVIGLGICAARMSRRRAISTPTRAYIGFFRTTPEMVLIFWVYFCLPLLLNIRLSAFWSGTLTLMLVAGAYLAEIFRAGIQSLPAGQFDAARALGLRPHQEWMLVILPQAVKRMLPAFMAYLTELLKNTALLSAIGVAELAYRASTLGADTFRYMEFLTAVAVMYFAIIYPLSLAARLTEHRLKRQSR